MVGSGIFRKTLLYLIKVWAMKYLVILASIMLTTVLVGCGGTSSPSVEEAKKLIVTLEIDKANENDKNFVIKYGGPTNTREFISFKKTNGQAREKNGVKQYFLEYEMVMKVTSSMSGVSTPSQYGVIEYEMTEKGWMIKDYNLGRLRSVDIK